VALGLASGSESELIREVAALLATDPAVTDHGRFVEAVLERQKLTPPLLGGGVALPHARTPAVSEIVFAAGRCREPVPFGATPVRLVFLFGVPPHRITEYLAMTAFLARRLRDPAVLEGLMQAPDVASFRALLYGS
jgi:mannitol/fructose-specific phosphotransferase system IIA component (Ntr-type)